jgi:hypothetical protein
LIKRKWLEAVFSIVFVGTVTLSSLGMLEMQLRRELRQSYVMFNLPNWLETGINWAMDQVESAAHWVASKTLPRNPPAGCNPQDVTCGPGPQGNTVPGIPNPPY